ncbi:MAG TPA: hypothetical protein VE422_33525 [Terriglobia bacterium]|nr:hypothetical protein [Terriglobia bacterium]
MDRNLDLTSPSTEPNGFAASDTRGRDGDVGDVNVGIQHDLNRRGQIFLAKGSHFRVEEGYPITFSIKYHIVFTVGALSLHATEPDETPNGLSGSVELQPADPRSNSGTSQCQSKGD